jgi:hypothetical protein
MGMRQVRDDLGGDVRTSARYFVEGPSLRHGKRCLTLLPPLAERNSEIRRSLIR